MDMRSTLILIGAILLLALLVGVVLVPLARLRGGGRISLGLSKMLVALPIRLFWRVNYVGFEMLPKNPPDGGLIVVSNHTSGLDPVLIEYRCNYDIRWMMWAAMMVPGVKQFARWKRTIPITFGAGDRTALRSSMEILKNDGVIGIFPEGGIERPAEHIRPFMHGVGLLVAKSKARVLLLHISGIPERKNAFTPILLPCRARIEVIGVIDFEGERDMVKITEDLRTRIQATSGWPLEDAPLVRDSSPGTPG
jgi:1-acyl-sn-glycerol-3-phosphate acyltransferase